MASVDLTAALEQHHSAAYGWALHCAEGNADEAADALQASYLKVLDGRARYAERSSFRTWLFGVIRHTAAEQRRRRAWSRPTGRAGRVLLEQARAPTDPAALLIRQEAGNRLRQAMAHLPERQRDVLHLVFYQDLTIADAAVVLGIALGTARTHYQRGKDQLRRRLETLR